MNWRMILRRALEAASAVFLAVVVSACAPKEIGTRPGAVVIENRQLPAGDELGTEPLTERIAIAPLDTLMIDVFGVQGMEQRRVTVDPSGAISFPLAGQLQAAGKTQSELAVLLHAALQAKHIRDPQVSVNIIESHGMGTFTVAGGVNQPGTFPLMGKTTLVRAIAAARGTNQDANSKTVLVFREVDGTDYVGFYNLTAIQRGNYGDPQIYPGDKIVVDESAARRLLRDIAPLLTAPIIAILNQL